MCHKAPIWKNVCALSDDFLAVLDVNAVPGLCHSPAVDGVGGTVAAGLGVAVGNAWGGTADHADYITGTNDEDGVAQAIEKFVLRR